MYYDRLDQVDLYLNGKNVEIALPIGERQPLESLAVTREPYSVAKPDKGMVTFRLDCSSREQVAVTTPNIPTEGPRWSAKVSRAVYSPIQMYVTLDWQVNDWRPTRAGRLLRQRREILGLRRPGRGWGRDHEPAAGGRGQKPLFKPWTATAALRNTQA